jgi:DNA-binding transcriptional regulator YiaG
VDGIALRQALASLKLPLYKAAPFLGVSDATMRNWANDRARVPQSVSMLLRLMIALKLDPAKVNEWLEDKR